MFWCEVICADQSLFCTLCSSPQNRFLAYVRYILLMLHLLVAFLKGNALCSAWPCWPFNKIIYICLSPPWAAMAGQQDSDNVPMCLPCKRLSRVKKSSLKKAPAAWWLGDGTQCGSPSEDASSTYSTIHSSSSYSLLASCHDWINIVFNSNPFQSHDLLPKLFPSHDLLSNHMWPVGLLELLLLLFDLYDLTANWWTLDPGHMRALLTDTDLIIVLNPVPLSYVLCMCMVIWILTH